MRGKKADSQAQLELRACVGVLHAFLGCIYLSLLEDSPCVHRRERDGSLLCL